MTSWGRLKTVSASDLSIERPTRSSFRESLLDKTKSASGSHTIEGFRAVSSAHPILAELCWFQFAPYVRVCDQLRNPL
jgi:hypothetical protein